MTAADIEDLMDLYVEEVEWVPKIKVEVNCYIFSLEFKQCWILCCEKRHCDSVKYTIYVFTHS